jgi:hypothetical protein
MLGGDEMANTQLRGRLLLRQTGEQASSLSSSCRSGPHWFERPSHPARFGRPARRHDLRAGRFEEAWTRAHDVTGPGRGRFLGAASEQVGQSHGLSGLNGRFDALAAILQRAQRPDPLGIGLQTATLRPFCRG